LATRLGRSRTLHKKLTRQLRVKTVQLKRQNEEVVKLRETLRDLDFKKGAKRRYFSTKGGLTLAARRCLSNVGSIGVGMMLGCDIHGKSVRSWEVTRCIFMI